MSARTKTKLIDGEFYPALASIERRTDLTSADKRVLAYLQRRLGGNGECWPSQIDIGDRLALHQGTVNRSTQRLRTKGMITAQLRGRGKGRPILHYQIIPLEVAENATNLEPELTKTQPPAPQGGQNVNPRVDEKSTGIEPCEESQENNTAQDDLKPKTAAEKRRLLSIEIAALYKHKIDRPRDRTCSPKSQGPKNILKLLKDHDAADLRQAIDNYAQDCQIDPTGFRFKCSNFFGKKAEFEGYMPEVYTKADPKPQAAPGAASFDLEADRATAAAQARRGSSQGSTT